MTGAKSPLQMSLFQSRTQNATWVARHLKTSPQTVCRMIEEGTLRAFRLRERGPWHVLLDSVDEFERVLREKHGLEARAQAGVR
jgi:hypothetical protein